MTNPFIRIITASAGTGKTYRLSLEYIGLIVLYYEHPEFRSDNILVLTFTKKATAEIRERIFSQMQILNSSAPDDAEQRQSLIQSLRIIVPGDPEQLTVKETNILISAYQELSFNKNLLQVMTIDSYINAIFRNLVRPIRSIDTFDIDLQSVEKRMPFLMNYLMQPTFRKRLQDLLQRKVRPSLDEYKVFFTSLIEQRWLHYMISTRIVAPIESSLCYQFKKPETWHSKAQDSFQAFYTALQGIVEIVANCASTPKHQGKAPAEFFKAEFTKLPSPFPQTFADFKVWLPAITASPKLCQKLLTALKKECWDMRKISPKAFPTETESLLNLQESAVTNLANYLIYSFFLPEQYEILSIWKDVLQEYDTLIYRYKNMTYEDVSWFTFESLFSDSPPLFKANDEAYANEFYHFLSHRSRFILIDEFQDTSLIQFNILHPIIDEITSGIGTKPFGGVVVVGDEKQSIFSWRGGERDLLLNLPAILGKSNKVEIVPLQESWRSSPQMMGFINCIFADSNIKAHLAINSMNWIYPEITSKRPDLDSQTEIQLCIQEYQVHGKNITTTLSQAYRIFINDIVKPNLTTDCNKTAILCRKSKELAEIQMLLDESGTSSMFQPSATLMEHDLIKPLISWLRFLAYQDWLEFFAFLRSNFVMLNAVVLKQCIDLVSLHEQSIRNCLQENLPLPEIDFGSLPLIQTFYDTSITPTDDSIHQKCLRIIELCQVHDRLSERDYLNLHSFLSVIHEYEINNSDKGISIPTLLQYLQDNIKQSFMQQRSIDQDNTLELQTIHKSKGLEYDRVFVFYNLSGGVANNTDKMNSFIEYANDEFENLRDFAISLHYNSILEKSSFGSIITSETKRAQLEEMNTLYVAFTRAKIKLHIFFTYNGSQAWEFYFKDKKTEAMSLPLLLTNACRNYMIEHGETTDYRSWSLNIAPNVNNDSHTEPRKPNPDLTNPALTVSSEPIQATFSLTLPDWQGAKPDYSDAIANNLNLDLKKIWLQDRANLIGNIVHYYLSLLHYNTPMEIDLAIQKSIAMYCNIWSATEIIEVLTRAQQALQAHAAIFDPQYDRIFTEFSVWDQGKEYRIDRFMVDTKRKDVWIIDYKTGGIEDKWQLQHYQDLLSALPAFHQQGYTFHSDYLSLKL